MELIFLCRTSRGLHRGRTALDHGIHIVEVACADSLLVLHDGVTLVADCEFRLLNHVVLVLHAFAVDLCICELECSVQTGLLVAVTDPKQPVGHMLSKSRFKRPATDSLCRACKGFNTFSALCFSRRQSFTHILPKVGGLVFQFGYGGKSHPVNFERWFDIYPAPAVTGALINVCRGGRSPRNAVSQVDCPVMSC